MLLRDLFVFSVVFGSLPFCFTRPYYGLLVFSWLGYMRAQDLAWGPARYFRFSFYVAILMFAGWLFFEKRPFMRKDKRTLLLIALMVWIYISILLNSADGTIYFLAPVLKRSEEFAKVIAVALFTTGMVDSKKRLHVLIWLIAFSLGFYGLKGAFWGALSGGRIIQGPGGMMKDNNDFCLALNMALPFVYYLALTSPRRDLRLFLFFTVFCMVVTIVLTTSRGGFLTVLAVGFVLTMKSHRKALGLTVGSLAIVIFLVSLPGYYVARMRTIKDPAEEASARARLDSWKTAWHMIEDRPVVGVGFYNFRAVFWMYDVNPDIRKGTVSRVAHNTYLQLWAESGTPALLLFLSAISLSIWRMRRLRRWNRLHAGPLWITNYAHMVEVSLIAFLVGGMFLNRAHFDLLYHAVAISVCLDRIAPGVIEELRPKGRRASRGALPQVKTADPFLVPVRGLERPEVVKVGA
ncbi:MAG: putative O-glycosylation ligase, exosortase A system-associated [Planctomycetota bacterium]